MTLVRYAVTIVLSLAGAGLGHAQPAGPPPVLPAALRGHVQGERFVPVAKVGDLPATVRETLHDLFATKTLDLAEPGAPFQATDVMVTPPLPARRLVAAGCSADHCLVYYERGGFAHVHFLVLLRFDGRSARVECGGLVSGGLSGLDPAKDALLSGKVVGGSKYW